ncbi:MAG: hypothetical protein ACTHOM_09220 [Allomuricauda sp.]
MRFLKTILLSTLTILVLSTSCKKSEAEKYMAYEKEQLKNGPVQDSLFMGLYFGMPKKEFREYCFDKNIEKKFWQGGRKNMAWVESDLEGLQFPAAINFYPNFTNDTITEMNAAIYYKSNVETDEPLESDALLKDVMRLLNNWYGGKTFKVDSPVIYKNDVYVHLKGNCRITVTPDLGGQMINLWFYDLKGTKKHKS